jgi:hypothetical protein
MAQDESIRAVDVDREVVPEDEVAESPIGGVEASAADVAEQRAALRETGTDEDEADWEADPADAADQRRSVGQDEDEYRG